MTDPRLILSRWLTPLVFSIALAALVVAAGMLMFSAFMFYDDEGYVLISLRNFIEHGGLYREVYTQYGPFPFVFYYVLDLLGLSLTHTTGRALTVIFWSGTAVGCAALAGRATGSSVARFAVLPAVFAYLWVMASEPTHPGGLIVVLTTTLAALGYHWISVGNLRAWAVAVGAITALLLLTKINVGVFAACSALAWWLLHHEDSRIRRHARWLLPLLAVVLPLGLMRALLGQPWVQSYALVFACSAVAVILTIGIEAAPRATWRVLGWGVLIALGLGLSVLGVVLARGTTPASLIDGILLAPLRQPVSFSIRYLWPPGIRLVAPVSLALCIAALASRHRRIQRADTIVAALRLFAALGVVLQILAFPGTSPDYRLFGWVMPCLWLFIWPLDGENRELRPARGWVTLLLLGQCLHVFPVPGSQIAWSTVVTLPLAAIGGWDAAAWLGRRFALGERRGGRFVARLAPTLVVGVALYTGWHFGRVGLRIREGSNLALPGAELVRLPQKAAALFRVLTFNAVAHADILFSMPGMFSLNLWSGVPPPTHANVTHWFSLLDERKQQAIIRVLDAHPRACVVVHREHIAFLTERGLGPKGPLYDYVKNNFVPAFVLDDFEFSVRRGRVIEPVLLADILARNDSNPGAGSASAPAEDTLLRLAVLLPPKRPVARVEISATDEQGPRLLTLDAGNARIETARTNFRSEAIAPAASGNWPLVLEQPAIVSLYYRRDGQVRPLRGGLIVLRDTAGEEVGLARLRLKD